MANRHVIGKLTIAIEARQQSTGFEQQQTVTDWMRSERLWRDLSDQFDQLVPDDLVLTIPRLELTVAAPTEQALRLALTEQFRDAIGQIMRTRNGQEGRVQSVRQRIRQGVHYFLETGQQVWTSSAAEMTDIVDWFRQLPDAPDVEFVHYLREITRTNGAVWFRFVYALGVENVKRFVLEQLPETVRAAKWLLELLDSLHNHASIEARITFWQILFRHSPLAHTNPIENFRLRISDLLLTPEQTDNTSALASAMDSEAEITKLQSETLKSNTETRFAVSNAGLVLLGPFLQALFRWLGLVEGSDFRDETARCRGIYLVQYMATGQTDAWEFDLMLNKILCGWAIDKPLPRAEALTEQEQEGADKLMQHVLDKWPRVRSVEALRTTFLQRAGTLTQLPDGNWRLQVEHKTVDILMLRPSKRTDAEMDTQDALSYPNEWGFSLLKFPWMPQILFTDW